MLEILMLSFKITVSVTVSLIAPVSNVADNSNAGPAA